MDFKKKFKQVYYLFPLFLLLLFPLTVYSQDKNVQKETNNTATKKNEQVIKFRLKNNLNNYTIDKLVIDSSFTKISSLTITVSQNLVMDLPPVPTNDWVSKSSLGSKTKNYLIGKKYNPNSQSVAVVINFLKNIKFSLEDANNKDEVFVDISISTAEIASEQGSDGKTHYYKFEESKNISWLEAYNQAKTKEYKGLKGYLATITSKDEHNFIYDSIAKQSGWLGGTRLSKTDTVRFNDDDSLPNNLSQVSEAIKAPLYGKWYWACGPEAGTIIVNGPTHASGFPINYIDWGWTNKEPNNSGGHEQVMQFAFSGKFWNDLPANLKNDSIKGYYVEFSEYGKNKEEPEDSHKAFAPQPITIKYIEKSTGKAIEKEKIIKNQNTFLGDSFDISAEEKTFDDYELIEKPNLTGFVTKNHQTLTFYYRKKYQNFLVKYQDTEGNILHEPTIVSEPVGSKIDVTNSKYDCTNIIKDLEKKYVLPQRPTNEKNLLITLDEDKNTIIYVFQGILQLVKGPDKISFTTGKIQALDQTLSTITNEAVLEIYDTRPKQAGITGDKRGHFIITGKLSVPFTNTIDNSNSLNTAQLTYFNGLTTIILDSTGGEVYRQNEDITSANDDTFYATLVNTKATPKENKYFSLKIPNGSDIRKNTTYKGKITWSLIKGP